jgi:squalene synthase HpnC
MAVNHYENFPVASWLCPPPLRPAVAAIYWFARTADDIADEGSDPPAQRLAALGQYRSDLRAVARGGSPSSRWPQVFVPLEVALRRHALPVALLELLLSAFEQDVVQARYASREALLDYCSRSANPVGRLLLHLYGVRDDASLQQSDDLCTALQLINFWQDLSIDLRRGRVYVPLNDCAQEAVTAEQLLALRHDSATRRLVARMVQWAEDTLRRGAPLAMRLPGRAGWELRLVVQGGLRILEKIRRIDHATLLHRPVVTWRDAPLLLLRASRMQPTGHLPMGQSVPP